MATNLEFYQKAKGLRNELVKKGKYNYIVILDNIVNSYIENGNQLPETICIEFTNRRISTIKNLFHQLGFSVDEYEFLKTYKPVTILGSKYNDTFLTISRKQK